MLNEIKTFLVGNWLDLLLVIVGALAFLTYILQERNRKSEAASLIVLQVEGLQKNMRKIKTYIVKGELDATAFYESNLLFKTDYWDKYKHYFIRKIDSFSFNTFDEFYSCACEVLAQQELMKNLEKNDFYLGQQALMNMEATLVINTINNISKSPAKSNEIIEGFMETIPSNVNPEYKNAIKDFLIHSSNVNSYTDMNLFWSLYNKDRQTVIKAFNEKAFTAYIPAQIKISLEKALEQFDSIPIIGCDGYKKLKKIANRRF